MEIKKEQSFFRKRKTVISLTKSTYEKNFKEYFTTHFYNTNVGVSCMIFNNFRCLVIMPR